MRNLTSFPAYFENADKILLLGPDPDNPMRLLFLPFVAADASYTGPAEVKTVPLTFEALRSRLHAAWEEKYRGYALRGQEETDSDQALESEGSTYFTASTSSFPSGG